MFELFLQATHIWTATLRTTEGPTRVRRSQAPRLGPESLASACCLGPGPSDVHPRVLAAMGMPLLGHLDPEFVALMDETQDLLRYVFQTENRLTLAVSGTGSAGMEAVVVNLIEPGDKMLVCVNGVFGGRMVDVAERAGAEVTAIERPYGEVFDPDEVKAAVERSAEGRRDRPRRDLHRGLAAGRGDRPGSPTTPGRLIAIDTVTSLGGVPVEIDAWGIDAVYSGTQKCLSCPPGLAPVTFGPRAVEAIDKRKTKVQSWYLDMSMIQQLLGERPLLPPHRADQHELRAPRGPGAGRRGRAGSPLRPARAEPPGPEGGAGRDGPDAGDGRRAPAPAAHLRPDSGRHRRPDGPQAAAHRVGHRDRRRARPVQGEGLADRPDGPRLVAANVTLVLAALETCLRDLGHSASNRHGREALRRKFMAE